MRKLCLILALSLLLSCTVQGGAFSKTTELDALFTTEELMDATVAELTVAMISGRLTAEKLVQMYIDRIEAYDQALGLNSIISLNPQAAEEARKADEALASGRILGRLHGIPVLVKDNIDVAGMATTCGDINRRNEIAKADSRVITLLKNEGAIILGKTNMSEYAVSGAESSSTMGGTVHNAYDLKRTPAGSSGGTAVAVTCNFAAVGLGTDTSSSIRRPASFANIVGLRPSFGLVSQHGLYCLNEGQDIIGPMCRNVEDAALLLDILAGSDSNDRESEGADRLIPAEGYTAALNAQGLEGKRIGYLASSFGSSYYQLDGKIEGLVEQAKQLLIQGGAELVDLSAALTDEQVYQWSVRNARSACNEIRTKVAAILEEHDIDAVIYLSQLDVAELQNYAWDESNNNPTCYINVFGPIGGLPEVMVPMGFSKADSENGFDYPLPLGLSIFSGYGADQEVLQIAYAFQQLAQARQQPPFTPSLPDAQLEALGQKLLQEAAAMEEASAAVQEAAGVLERICMAPSEDDSRSPVTVQAYEGAVRQLAEAMDAHTAALQPSEPEPEAASPPASEIITFTFPTEETPAAEAPQEKDLAFLWYFLPVLLVIPAGLWLLLRHKKKAATRN
ncbi:MAG: amidase [Oscillospiraceae bacterium]|nr:amidase [Oscillospiraceae bacterium]